MSAVFPLRSNSSPVCDITVHVRWYISELGKVVKTKRINHCLVNDCSELSKWSNSSPVSDITVHVRWYISDMGKVVDSKRINLCLVNDFSELSK